jgi:ABC-type dipeptide/oligopeptide/nickel transport system permease component
VLVFLMLRMIPGDPARLLLGESANPDELARLRTQLGLDQSYLTQYAIYIKNLLMGDFGKSVRTGAPIASEIGVRLLATIELSLAAMVTTLLGWAGSFLVKQFSSRCGSMFSPSSAFHAHLWLGSC